MRELKLSYQERLELFKSELKSHHHYKKKTILELAKDLEREGVVKSDIMSKISDDLRGWVARSWISICLPDEYKQKFKSHKRVLADLSPIEKQPLAAVIGQGSQRTELDPEPILDEEAREAEEAAEQRESEIFHQKLSETLDNRKNETINDVIVKELDQARETIAELQQKLDTIPQSFEETEEYLLLKDLKNSLDNYRGVPFVYKNGQVVRAFDKDTFTRESTIEIQGRDIPILVEVRHSTEQVLSVQIDKQKVKMML